MGREWDASGTRVGREWARSGRTERQGGARPPQSMAATRQQRLATSPGFSNEPEKRFVRESQGIADRDWPPTADRPLESAPYPVNTAPALSSMGEGESWPVEWARRNGWLCRRSSGPDSSATQRDRLEFAAGQKSEPLRQPRPHDPSTREAAGCEAAGCEAGGGAASGNVTYGAMRFSVAGPMPLTFRRSSSRVKAGRFGANRPRYSQMSSALPGPIPGSRARDAADAELGSILSTAGASAAG